MILPLISRPNKAQSPHKRALADQPPLQGPLVTGSRDYLFRGDGVNRLDILLGSVPLDKLLMAFR